MAFVLHLAMLLDILLAIVLSHGNHVVRILQKKKRQQRQLQRSNAPYRLMIAAISTVFPLSHRIFLTFQLCQSIDLIERLNQSDLIPKVIRRPPRAICSVRLTT